MNTIWIIIIATAILTAFNLYYLFYLRSHIKNGNKVLETDSYYKLDAKIELLKYLALGFISVAALFGISKFSDLSQDAEKVESLSIQYDKMAGDYKRLLDDFNGLKSDSEEIQEKYSTAKSDLKEIEFNIYKQDHKIQEATRKIPEANIRLLTKRLAEYNLKEAGFTVFIAEETDIEAIKKAVSLSSQMLKSSGFSEEEIEDFLNEMKSKYPQLNEGD